MEDVLKQINAVSGTIGSLVYDDRGRLIAHLFPKIFDSHTLEEAIATISGNLPGLDDITGGAKAVDFRFQGGRVIIRQLDGGWLVLLCEASINLQTLSIALNLVVRKIEKFLKEGVTAAVAPAAAAAPPPVNAASPRELIDRGALSGYLQGMQTALAKYMGPMSKIIFVECVENWLRSHQPDKSSLPHLIDIVAAEIGDPAKMTEYRQKASALLN